jgi:hypothetical protein
MQKRGMPLTNMNARDMQALVAYVRSMPAVEQWSLPLIRRNKPHSAKDHLNRLRSAYTRYNRLITCLCSNAASAETEP